MGILFCDPMYEGLSKTGTTGGQRVAGMGSKSPNLRDFIYGRPLSKEQKEILKFLNFLNFIFNKISVCS